MKTIFLCIPTLASAGAERFVTELACNLDRMKYKPVVVVTSSLDKESVFYKKLISLDVMVVDASANNFLQETRNIVSAIKKYEPIILHSNVGASLHILPAQIISRTKARHIFTVHSMGYRIFKGMKRALMKFCFKTKIVIPVAICDTVKKSVEDAYGLESTFVECIYNGVDTNYFKPEKRKYQRTINFVVVGTLYHIKNHELLVKAFGKLHATIPSTCLIVVGDGELRGKLEKLVDQLKLKSAIQFVGNQQDVKPYLNASDIYCCSSKVEGLPLSVLEAMACGLPVITTPAGGVVDIVNDENGIVVKDDCNAYANAMELIAKDEKMMSMLGLKSREKATKLDIKECALQYQKLYDKYSKD